MFCSRISSPRAGQDEEIILKLVDSRTALKAIASKYVKYTGYSIATIRKLDLLEHDNYNACLIVALSRIFGDTGFVVVFNSKEGEVVINHVEKLKPTSFAAESNKGTRQNINPDCNGDTISLHSSNGQEVFLKITTETREPVTVFTIGCPDGHELHSDLPQHPVSVHPRHASYRSKYMRLVAYFVGSWLVYFTVTYLFDSMMDPFSY